MRSAMTHDLSMLTAEAHAVLNRRAAFYIGGARQEARAVLPVIDPASGAQIAEIGAGGAQEINAAVQAAKSALANPAWRDIGPAGRERLLLKLAEIIEAKAQVIAQVETVDNGMPGWFAMGLNAMGSAEVYRYFAGWPSKLTGKTMDVSGPPGWGKLIGITRREPVGVVGAIVPWNVPFMMAAWKLAPALAAGCTVVLKPAEDTSLSAMLLGDLIAQAGFPPGVVNIVSGRGPEAGEALVRHPDVAKVSFTGSTATGRHVGMLAGRHIKKVTLELGGKSPTIIFDDADLDKAVVGAANSIFLNSGQICVAGSRLYVQSQVYGAVLERLKAHLPTLTVGAGLRDGVFMGPLVSEKHRARVQSYIDRARGDGLTVIQGQSVEGARGFFVSPTIVTGADAKSPITCEEIFGPVLSVYRFTDTEDLIAAANGTDYGLAASLWSKSLDRVFNVAEALQCGKVSINNPGFPYPGLPEGGYKSSGFGRDLGADAVEQNLQTKTILLAV
jgi:phenylacetaldehyde dehydrogenase